MNTATLSLKVDLRDAESLELLDELDGSVYTRDLLTQYFACLYRELSKRAGAEGKGIRKTAFLEVTHSPSNG